MFIIMKLFKIKIVIIKKNLFIIKLFIIKIIIYKLFLIKEIQKYLILYKIKSIDNTNYYFYCFL